MLRIVPLLQKKTFYTNIYIGTYTNVKNEPLKTLILRDNSTLQRKFNIKETIQYLRDNLTLKRQFNI